MLARCGRWGRFLERRAQQLQRQVQAKEERIIELETENAVLHLKLAEYQGRMGTRSHKATRPGHGQGPLQRTRSPWTQLHHTAQALKQDLKELRSFSVQFFKNCWAEHRDCLSGILTAVERAQLQLDALPSWQTKALHLEQRLQEMEAQYHLEQQRRRRLHNALVELKGSIRVHCRIRPLLPFDDESHDPGSHASPAPRGVAHAVDNETVLVKCSRPGHPSINKTFTFERVYGPADPQSEVFGDVRPLLTSLLDGLVVEDVTSLLPAGIITVLFWYNICIMAYGQTGSGKSHTVLGPHSEEGPVLLPDCHSDLGLVPRAAEELFRLISESPSRRAKVEVSIVEVYNDDIFDLLAEDTGKAKPGVKCEVLTTKKGRKEVSPLTHVSVCSAQECMRLVGAGLQLRATRATAAHAHSSRSHLIITVTLTTAPSRDSSAEQGSDPSLLTDPGCPWPQQPATGRRQRASHRASSGSPGAPSGGPTRHAEQVRAKLQLVDLAGSECAGVSGVTGSALRETSFINRSLAALADVLGALSERRGHVPYRNSKLTHMLQDALGGDAKLLVILCVSPCQKHVAETLQSLGFGVRARQAERGRPAPRKPQ